MVDLANLYSSEIFDVIITIKQISSTKVWIGEAIIIRKDTGEEVRGGCVRYGDSNASVAMELQKELENISEFLSTAPPDWNSRVRKILARNLISGQSVTDFSFRIQSMTGENEKSEKLIDDFFSLCSKLKSDVIYLIKEIESLTDDERLELLTSEDAVYSSPTDPWNLDDLTSRSLIFRYFLNPSEEEIKQHKIHQDRMEDL